MSKHPGFGHERDKDDVRVTTLPIALNRVPQITAYLDSIKGGDEDILKMRLAEIKQEKWTVAEWNTFGIAARVALINHQSYGLVMSAIQEMGGY